MKVKNLKLPSHFWLPCKNPIEKSGDFYPKFFFKLENWGLLNQKNTYL